MLTLTDSLVWPASSLFFSSSYFLSAFSSSSSSPHAPSLFLALSHYSLIHVWFSRSSRQTVLWLPVGLGADSSERFRCWVQTDGSFCVCWAERDFKRLSFWRKPRLSSKNIQTAFNRLIHHIVYTLRPTFYPFQTAVFAHLMELAVSAHLTCSTHNVNSLTEESVNQTGLFLSLWLIMC